MLYMMSGEDDYSLDQALGEIKRGIGDQSLLSANTTEFDGRQMRLDQFTVACATVSFLAEKRLVIVRGLLERFESKSKPRRQKKIKNKPDQEREYKLLVDCINNMPDSTVLVLIDGKIKSSNPLLKELSGKSVRKFFPLLKGDRLEQWVQGRVKEQDGSIAPQAVRLLVRTVGGDLWTMANEIDKLILFALGRRIEEEDIKQTVSYLRETSVFSMIDAILQFRAGVAEQFLERLMQGGAAPVYLLYMLSRQINKIFRAKELMKKKKSEAEIQSKLGLTNEFALRKTLEQAGRYPAERLEEVYHKLLETDISIKTGKYDDGLALNILIAELCQQRRAGKTG